MTPRDPLLDYKRPRLIELLHEARTERDEASRQLRKERIEVEQCAQVKCADLEQRHHQLLQEHMSCGVKIVRLEAKLAAFGMFMYRYRSSLQREE